MIERDRMIERERYLGAIGEEAARLSDAAELGLDRPVPTCPGWDVERLVRHVTGLFVWVHALVESAPDAVDRSALPRTPQGADLLPYFGEAARAVVAALGAAEPDAAIESWAGGVTTSWWIRRLAHETATHRQDAQLAAGDGATLDPVDADLAVDGVDEALTLFLPLAYNAAAFGTPASVHLHATDAEGEWIVRLGETVEVDREHVKGDAAARGPASDLFAVLWHRGDPAELDVIGDADVFERFLRFTSV
jgi:uncharacterized protein (TIGR03083 family)